MTLKPLPREGPQTQSPQTHPQSTQISSPTPAPFPEPTKPQRIGWEWDGWRALGTEALRGEIEGSEVVTVWGETDPHGP